MVSAGGHSEERVLRSRPRPRSEAPDCPVAVESPTDCANEIPPPLFELNRSTNSCALTAPDFAMSSRLITVTGNAVSASMRLIDEPVISTRCKSCCATAEPEPSINPLPNASSTPLQTLVRLNIETPSKAVWICGRWWGIRGGQAPLFCQTGRAVNNLSPIFLKLTAGDPRVFQSRRVVTIASPCWAMPCRCAK